MPIYMDVHIVPGVKAKDVAEAHRKDLLHQDEHECKCMTYWIDEERENIFCLIEAPDKDAVKEMHRKAHGLVPHKIIEVSSKVVKSFLGRIFDPEEAETTDAGLKVFEDSSFRVLLVTRIADPVLLRHKVGIEKADELLARLNDVVRKNLAKCGGSEVEHSGVAFIVSFTSAATAVSCALSIAENVAAEDADLLDLKIAVNGGDPVEKSNKLFGDVIQQGINMCAATGNCRVAVASSIKELVAKNYPQKNKPNFVSLSPGDEELLQLLFNRLEDNFHNAEFDVDGYSRSMAMSTSQLYRKTVELTGLSPNQLLKEYRLTKAKELMRQKPSSISQITFDTGFSSPSYFTKCFKKKYGVLPMAYVDMLH
jgi:AraC-like DNA-binding protein